MIVAVPLNTTRATLESAADIGHSHSLGSEPHDYQVCLLLTLPSELRRHIHTLLHSHSGSLPLLPTWHQVREETMPTIPKLPTSFSSQAKLYTWLHRVSDSEIKRLKVLTLRLTDIDLTPLFEEPSSSSTAREPRRNAWSLYQQDLAKLDRAMQALTGLTDLTIIPPEQGTALVRGMYLTALGIVAGRCKGLRCLTVRDEEGVREHVPGLKGLGKVVFEGKEVVVKKEARSVVVKVEVEEDEW